MEYHVATMFTTLIATGAEAPRQWNDSTATRRIIFAEDLAALCKAFDDANEHELHQVILDRFVDAEGFLSLLSRLPTDFLGDVLFVGDSGGGYLSSSVPRGGRISYRLDPEDVRFYLEVNALVSPPPGVIAEPAHSTNLTFLPPVSDAPVTAMNNLVLVVDDEDAVRDAVAEELHMGGWSVLTCSDIESAQVIVESQPVTAIVSDVRLTGPFAFEGLEFVHHVMKHRPDCRIVLMSGGGTEEMRREAKARGATELLFKPFSFDDLEKVLIPPGAGQQSGVVVNVPNLETIVSTGSTYPVFHPIMGMGGVTRTYGFECLTRVATDTPLRNPALFFRYAERKNSLFETELRCMESAIADTHLLPADASIFINVHPHTLSREGFDEAVVRIAGRNGVDLRRVVLEITEQGAIDDLERCIANIETLRACGVRFALDDVGIAYSHLLHIQRIQPSFLKVSQEFGTDFEIDENKRKIVRNIVALARSFGCEVILEGVETAGTAVAATAMGIRYLQGYLYGKPARASALLAATA